MPRRAADLLVDCLAAHGVDRAFCVPGESYLAVLDALHERNAVETVVCRHEGGAGLMEGAGESIEFTHLYLTQSSLGTVPNLLRLLHYPGVPQ